MPEDKIMEKIFGQRGELRCTSKKWLKLGIALAWNSLISETFVSQWKVLFIDIAPVRYRKKGTACTLSKKRYSALGIFNTKSDTVTGTDIGTSTRIGTAK